MSNQKQDQDIKQTTPVGRSGRFIGAARVLTGNGISSSTVRLCLPVPLHTAVCCVATWLLLLATGPASLEAQAPSAPVLTAEADDENTIVLLWAVADSGSSAITAYRIETSDNPTSGWTVLEDSFPSFDPAVEEYEHMSLQAGSTHFYRVSAFNATEIGPVSNVAGSTTDGAAGTAPGAPTNVMTEAEASAIGVSWTAPSDTGSSAIWGYAIEAGDNIGSLFFTSYSTTTSFREVNLPAGQQRFYRVYAHNAAGLGAGSEIVADTTVLGTRPGPPTGLTAEADGDSAIDLSWTAPADTGGSAITGYRVERSRDGGNTWPFNVEAPATAGTLFRDETVDADSTYHYRVSAINSIGTSLPSNVASATATAAQPPGAPTGLTAEAVGDSAIDLSWTAPADTGSSAITGYRIEVSTNRGLNWSDLLANTNTTSVTYTHSGLAASTTRHYRVRAINGSGAGLPSNVANATTDAVASGKPGAPTGLTAEADGDTAIDLSWTAPADSGSGTIVGYQVQLSGDGGSNWNDLAFTTTTSYKHAGLRPNTTLHYRVAAVNSVGRGEYSSVATATTDGPGQGRPGAPRNLTASPDGDSAIALSWTPPSDTGSSAITGYRIEVSGDGGLSWTDLQENTRSLTPRYRHTGLPPATTRHYRVSAVNNAGAGAPSEAASATTHGAVPSAPTGLVAAPQGTNRINLSWASPAHLGGSALVGYRIEVSADGGGTWRDLVSNTNSTATSFAHTGLPAAATRYYRVSAINSTGTGPSSNVAFATTDPIVPGAPTNLRARAIGSSEIELTWNTPSTDGGSPVTSYRIQGWGPSATGWTTLVDNTGSTATVYLHEGLDPAASWRYRVMAINAAGAGPASNTATATTDAGPPGPPRELSATARGANWIELTWRAPESTGGLALSGYQIEVYEEGTSTWTILVANTGSTLTQYHHLGLDPGTTWYYRVSGVNSVGAGESSAVASATTDAVPPGRPTKLTATANGPHRIELLWFPPEQDGGSSVTGYRIEVFEEGGDSWRALEENTRSTSIEYAHTGLDPASTRTYRVVAINAVGPGDPSNMATATTDPVVPGEPRTLRATANGTSQIDLSWGAPDYDGGAPVAGYEIEVSDNGGATWATLIADTRSTATIFPHAGLRPATTRHYRVSAINRVGAGEPSNIASATTDATVPDRPEELVASAHDHARIDLDWQAPSFDGGARITGYRIEVSENAGATWAELIATTGSANTSYAHAGLAPATTRHYRVSAINPIGRGPNSNVASATTDAIAPDPPTNLTATAVSPTQIDLAWRAPTYDGGAPVTSYRIEVSEDGDEWTDLEPSTGSNATSYAHTGLKPGSTRYYRVSAMNSAGTGMPSGIAVAVTDDPVERAGRVNLAILPHFAAAMTSSTLSAISARIESVESRRGSPNQVSGAGLPRLTGAAGLSKLDGGPTLGHLLDGAFFALPLGRSGGQEDTPGITAGTWGGAEYHSMGEPESQDVRWEGDMLTLHVGTDMRVRPNLLLGVAASRSAGNYTFTDFTGGREVAGTYQPGMTSLNPYVAWFPGRAGVSLWAVAGMGWGEAEIDEKGGKRATDVRMRTAAVGGRRVLVSNGWSSIGLRGEGWVSGVEVEDSEEMDSLHLEVGRIRLGVEWIQTHRSDEGHEARLVLEGAMRYDNGDATTGMGTELGAGFRYVSPSEALVVEGHGRVRQARSDGYREWGIRGRIDVSPQGVGQGFLLSLTPVWGASRSGVHQLWQQGVGDRLGQGLDAPNRGQINAQIEYGLPTFEGTPYGRFQIVQEGARVLGTGMRYSLTRVLDLGFEGTRSETAAGPARHRLVLKGDWRF